MGATQNAKERKFTLWRLTYWWDILNRNSRKDECACEVQACGAILNCNMGAANIIIAQALRGLGSKGQHFSLEFYK